MNNVLTSALVDAAITGDATAQGRLIRALTPPIQAQVAKMLRRWRVGTAAGRDLRQEMEDMVQEALLELFEDNGKVLRRWEPDRLPLDAYVGYIARIRTAEVLRSRRSPWREEPNDPVDLAEPADAEALPTPSPERSAMSRDVLSKIYICLASRFKPSDAHLFDLLIVEEKTPQDAAAVVGKSVDAVYQWRSRLYKRARECREKVSKIKTFRQRLQGGDDHE